MLNYITFPCTLVKDWLQYRCRDLLTLRALSFWAIKIQIFEIWIFKILLRNGTDVLRWPACEPERGRKCWKMAAKRNGFKRSPLSLFSGLVIVIFLKMASLWILAKLFGQISCCNKRRCFYKVKKITTVHLSYWSLLANWKQQSGIWTID